jgi:hypothetical protein
MFIFTKGELSPVLYTFSKLCKANNFMLGYFNSIFLVIDSLLNGKSKMREKAIRYICNSPNSPDEWFSPINSQIGPQAALLVILSLVGVDGVSSAQLIERN